jgi:SulP family sulfate permease
MAGTLLLHCGIDLFVEGIYDSFGKYDCEWTACTYYVFSSLYFLLIYSPWIDLEYTGIWAIALVMTLFGMEAALVAGAVSALLTYAIQSASYPKPIR